MSFVVISLQIFNPERVFWAFCKSLTRNIVAISIVLQYGGTFLVFHPLHPLLTLSNYVHRNSPHVQCQMHHAARQYFQKI